MDRVVAVLGKNKVKEAIEVAKHLEQANAKQNIKKKRIDRDSRKRSCRNQIYAKKVRSRHCFLEL